MSARTTTDAVGIETTLGVNLTRVAIIEALPLACAYGVVGLGLSGADRESPYGRGARTYSGASDDGMGVKSKVTIV